MIAIFLVGFAVLISSLRLLLPYAHNYRIDLQNYINETYGSNIIIGSLEMGWQSTGPSLVATNVSLLSTDATEIYVQALNMNVDFWGSIQNRRILTTDIQLDGVKVLFDKTMLEDTNVSQQDNSLVDNISELFLSQIGRFTINNSQVIYRTGSDERTFLISSLHWLNNKDKHRARGNVILDGLTSNNMQLNLDVTGKTIADMNGKLYLSANQLNITPWLDRVLAIDDENTHSTINFDAWLTIENGAANKLLVDLGQNQIAWQHEEAIRTLNVNQGQFVFEHLNDPANLAIYSSDIQIRSNEEVWQPLRFELKRGESKTNIYLSKIDIAGISDLLPLFIEQQDTEQLIEELNPAGYLSDVHVQIEQGKLSSIANFSDVVTQYSQGIPSIENAHGQILYANEQVQVSIQAQDGALDFDNHFAAPIEYQSLSSLVDITVFDAGWQVNASDISFVSENVKLNANLSLRGEAEQDIEMSLLATAMEGNTENASQFYPHQLMGDNLVNYLNRSLTKGQLEQAVVLINGPITHFPYEDGDGVFVVNAELKDATFKFDQHWPAIKHFGANLNFTNNSMAITGREGSLGGIDVEGVRVAIADLSKDQILTVDASFEETAPELVTNLMLTSPLDESVGAVLEQLVVQNNVSGSFDLSLPLDNTDQAIAKGTVKFDNNTVDLQSPDMHFTNVLGELSFVNDKIETEGLSLLWRNMPMSLEVLAGDKEAHYQTAISLSANWGEQAWQNQIPELLKSYSQGSLNWLGMLTLNNYHDGKFNYSLDIESSLIDTQLDIPSPFNKQAEESVNVVVTVSGDEDQSTIDAKFGEQLKFYGNLNHQLVNFSQAHLILGHEQMYLPLNGFHITTKLAEAKFGQWQPFILDIIESLPNETNAIGDSQIGLLEKPERIRGSVGDFQFLDESLSDVVFNLEDQLSWWLLEVNAKDARAKIKFFPDWQKQGIDVDADLVHLSADKQLLSAEDIDKETESEGIDEKPRTVFDISINDELFADIPPMTFNCAECSYADLQLGEVTFSLKREQENTLVINNFVAKRKNNKLSFDAKWQHDNLASSTVVIGEFDSKDIEREFERLGLPSTVRDSGLKSKFNFNWVGGPQNFAIANFNGQFSGELDEGYLAEVPDQARAFSILSLQSLVRKLKFDFRDIFSDGMFYSEIKGDFNISSGVVYTKNTFLKGSAGDLSVKGNTDLNTETLDYSMSYKPNVTSSLPAIAWIATLNPVTFLAGIAIDEVITSNVVSEYKIEVTGSISEPHIKEVDRKTQNISVGRDSPPQVVENLPAEESKKTTHINPETGLLEEREQLFPGKSDG